MTCPKVTIVIPTRERPDTLAKSLKTALNQDWPNLEVIVSDNFSGPGTAEVVRAMNDPRVTYLNTGRRLSMSHNWEFAISGIKEGWIVLIGDDDGLLPNSLGRVVRLVEKHGVEALVSRTCAYNWPSRGSTKESILSVPMGRGEDIIDARRALTLMMNWIIDGPPLPQLYTEGLISAGLINRIRNIKGTFFQSQIPDIYSGVAIASVIDRYLFTREPFSIAGASAHSSGAATYNFKSSPFLEEDNIPFHSDIPLPSIGTFTFSAPAMVCESFLQSQYLRRNGLNLSPERILELIFNETQDAGRPYLDDWALLFARRHELPIGGHLRGLRKRPLNRRLSSVRTLSRNLFERYRIDCNHDLIPNDVFEASLAAATILATRPPMLPSIANTVSRVVKRNICRRIEATA